eukprot:m.19175 g.19175  ORF g.19175 m.19175 type:complete len:1213 (+) comp9885_c0_seq1:490-4128(+)
MSGEDLYPEVEEVEDDHRFESDSAGMQIQTVDEAAAIQQRFAEKIQGNRRNAQEDDSAMAFGESLAEKFGEQVPMPSAPPMTEDIKRQQAAWARATQLARMSFPEHENNSKFYKDSGLEGRRKKNPYLAQEDLPEDVETREFKEKVSAARQAHASLRLRGKKAAGGPPWEAGEGGGAGGIQISDDPAIVSLILGISPPKDYATFGDVYIPQILLAQQDLEPAEALKSLQADDQFDEVQHLANEAARIYKSTWVFGKKVAGGTLEVRMNAERSKMIVLGEGYKQLNLGGAEGWTTIAKDIPKDTEYFHTPSEFTIIRINAGHVGLCQKTGRSRVIVRLLPGRYVLPERFVRFIGVAKIVPNQAVTFTPHPGSVDPDIGRLARRYTSFYLQQGYRLFVQSRDGTFPLDADANQRPFIFDAKAMEVPLNIVNPRDFVQQSSDSRYSIIRLQSGQRIVVRGSTGNDVLLESDDVATMSNTYHLSKVHFDFDGKVHTRDNKIVSAENLTSVKLTPNDVLVLRDADGIIRFFDEFDSQQSFTIRPPWMPIATIPALQNEYTYDDGQGMQVARVKPSGTQWPIVHDVRAGDVKLFPHSIEYVFSSAEQQVYIGMADRTKKEPQMFEVPGIGTVVIAVVNSGQLAMCRLNNVSFFLPPLSEPYVLRPPHEFLGMADTSQTHIHIPTSDLHRIYVPAGKWAVAMVDGRQVILDPAAKSTDVKTERGSDEGNGIWIFRSQHLVLEGPEPIDSKVTSLFNVTRLQVPVNEIAFGVDSSSGDRIIWPSGNHTINKNTGQVFQGFFSTQLEDVKIEKFDVVWNGGVRSTVDASVGFHILSEEVDGKVDLRMMRTVLNLCQNHEDLHAKVVENTKHQLFDVIAQIEPLGYSSLSFEDESMNGGKSRKETTLQDLEKMFSSHVDSILKKYGIVVDNVTITKIDLAQDFIARSEEVQKARMDARQKVLVAEQELQRNQILQQQDFQEQQSRTRAEEELSKQREIERKREVDDIAAKAEADAQSLANQQKVAYEAELIKFEAEARGRIKQEELRIKELEQTGLAAQVEMETRKKTAVLEAETRAVEQSAQAKAEAMARKEVAETLLEATRLEVEAQKLKAEGDRASGLAKTAVELNSAFGGLEQDPAMLLELLKLRSAVEGQSRIAEATARCTDPELVRMMGRLQSFEEILPQICQPGLAMPGYGVPTPHPRRFGSINPRPAAQPPASE